MKKAILAVTTPAEPVRIPRKEKKIASKKAGIKIR
jgi:hypothetical protein